MTASHARIFRRFDKTKVEAKREQEEMNDGAEPADFWRQDKTGAEQRHRHLGKVEIEFPR